MDSFVRIYTLDINLTDSKELSTRSQRENNVLVPGTHFPHLTASLCNGPRNGPGLVLPGQGCELHSREHRKYGVELRFFKEFGWLRVRRERMWP